MKKYIENIKVQNKLSNNESEKCEEEITIEDCTNTIFKMKLNKAPGLDGLSVEFYRKFWNSSLRNKAVVRSPWRVKLYTGV